MHGLTPAALSQLAIGGGNPTRPTWLPYGKQSICDKDVASVVSVLVSDWLTQGPKIEQFEDVLSLKSGCDHAIAVNSGTAALHAAYFAVGIGMDDEIVMPAMSFAATANAAVYLGAKPVFVDIRVENGNICVESAKSALSNKTRAIVGVDYGGNPCDLGELRDLARAAQIPFIVDGAHSLGAFYHGRPAAQIADLTTFSFHPVKVITTGEGGAIVTNNQVYAERMRLFRSHGIEKKAINFLAENEGPWYHEMQCLGYNYRMTEIQAALGLSQLEKLEEFVRRRTQIAHLYERAINSTTNFRCISEKSGVQSAYHLFPVLVNSKLGTSVRKFVVEALHAENIGVQVHYMPIYHHPFYKQRLSPQSPCCPATEEFYRNVFSLPIFPAMTDTDVESVVEAIRKVDRALSASRQG